MSPGSVEKLLSQLASSLPGPTPLDRYLSVPAQWSIEGLLHDPLIDLLRDHPRFQALLEKYEK